MTDKYILAEEITTLNKRKIGRVTLNRPQSMNALNSDMIDRLYKQLQQWRNDRSIACVILDGAGEKSFCAGGDIQALYRGLIGQAESPSGSQPPCATDYFEREYRLDYLIHTYPIPIIAWGKGIVMGGGLGLFIGAKFRVVTETTKMAMPEVTIALFPDVGTSYFLNRLPAKVGRFMSLTAATLNCIDGLYLGLADFGLGNDQLPTIIEQLSQANWTENAQKNSTIIENILHLGATDFSRSIKNKKDLHNEIEGRMATIESLCSPADVHTVLENIHQLNRDDPWLNKARLGSISGSPLNALIIDRHLQSCSNLSLKDVFQADLTLAANIVNHTEIIEGVRALLIDKDRTPQWLYKHHSEVPDAVVDPFFIPPWDVSPLADL